MAGNELTFSTRGAADVAAATKKMREGLDAMAKGAQGVNEKLKLSSDETKRLEKLQKDLARTYESSYDRYLRKLNDAKTALAGHKNEVNLLKKATADLLVEYLKASDAGRNTWDKQKAQAKAVEERTRALNRELAKLPPLYDKAEKEAKDFAHAVDLGAKYAGKTREQILGIKTQQSASFGQGAIAKIGAWAASFASVHTALRLVTEEMQLQQELVDKRNQTQVSVAEARNTLIRTLAGSSDDEVRQALAASESIARGVGVSETKIAPALGDAISAIGGDVGKASEATRIAASYMRGSPDQIVEMAGSLLDVSKATGTADATTNLGLYQLLGKLSRVNNPNQMQQTIPSAMVGASSYGASYQEGGALFAAISNASADKFGRTTRTATVNLAEQLMEYDLGSDSAKAAADKAAEGRAKQEKSLAKERTRLADLQAQYGRSAARANSSQLEDLEDAELDVTRAQEDLKFAKSPAARRTAQRRLDDARARQKKLLRTQPEDSEALVGQQKRIADSQATIAALEADIAKPLPDGAALQKQAAAFKGMGISERIQFLQQNPAFGEAFFTDKSKGGFGASFEAKPRGAVRDLLLDANSVAAKEFSAAMSQIPDLAGLNAIGVEELGRFDKFNKLEPVAERGRALASALESLQTDLSATGSIPTEQRKMLQEALMDSGFSGIGAKWQNWVTGIGDGGQGLTAQSAIEMMKTAQFENRGSLLPGMKMPDDMARRDEVLTRLIGVLEKAEGERQRQMELQERQTKAAEEMNEAMKNGSGFVGGNQ